MPVRGLLEDERADGHRDVQVVGGPTGTVGALAVLAVAGLEFGVKAEVDEGVLGGRGDDVHRAAVAAVAAIGAAARDELLAAETEAAVASVSGHDLDVDVVDEHAVALMSA